MRRLLLASLLLIIPFAASCSSSPTAPGGQGAQNVHSCGGGSLTGSMSATVDGTNFVATCLDAMTIVQGIYGFGGTNVTQSNVANYIDIAMAVQASAPGTFQLGHLTPNNASVSVGGSQQWQAGAASNGSGTIVVTVLSASELAGTFTFDMVAGPGGTGAKTVRNGQFDIKF